MFFGHLASDNSPLTMFHHTCARLIFNIASRLRPGLRWRKEKWAHQVRMLVHDLGSADATDRIIDVLEWLVTKYNKHNIQIASAEGFRRHFNWLEKAYIKQRPFPDEPLSADASKVLKNIKRLLWPKGVPDDLQLFVQISEKNYLSFRVMFKAVFINRDKHPKLKGAINHLFRKLSDPVTFLTKWTEQVHKRLANWTEWSGNLKPFAFRHDSKMLVKLGTGWAREYDGTGKCWFTVMSVISQEWEG